MKTVRFGVIGTGLMGKEFASAAARWCHLINPVARPEIVAIASRTPSDFPWFEANFPSLKLVTEDYKELLASPDVDAVYVAVPHNLHEEVYSAAIRAGKHLFGEKPFGIDIDANRKILQVIKDNPSVFVRCCSQFPFFPGMQRIGTMIDEGAFGHIIEVEAGFLHSSDLNREKPINWKRRIETNGEYGVMGDLGMHVCHVPFRAGWTPRNVRAILSNIVEERPDGKGGREPCATWDNATLLCESSDPVSGAVFPMLFRTQRIAPGEMNTWYFTVKGEKTSARFSSRHAGWIDILDFRDGSQDWRQASTGYTPTHPTISGGIFEFGFTDAVLQMWAAFLHEMVEGKPLSRFSQTATPDEAHWSHRLFTASLESQREGTVVTP